MRIVPLSLREANAFVEEHHRHNSKVVSHKFSIGLEKDRMLVGVAIGGIPIARLLNDGKTLELRRICTLPSVPNACSKLMARAKRIGQLMGYERFITYTLQREPGTSLRAVGAKRVKSVPPGNWKRANRPSKYQPVYDEPKWRWEL